jgi:hypothetical protein
LPIFMASSEMRGILRRYGVSPGSWSPHPRSFGPGGAVYGSCRRVDRLDRPFTAAIIGYNVIEFLVLQENGKQVFSFLIEGAS